MPRSGGTRGFLHEPNALAWLVFLLVMMMIGAATLYFGG
jgi:hypothetical protein